MYRRRAQVFHKVAKEVDGKTVPDVIEFYYMWKKTGHYKQWKAMWRSEQAVLHAQDDDSDEEEDMSESASGASSSYPSAEAERNERAQARGRKNGSSHGGRASA